MSFLNHGILGINARNLLYIKPFNPKVAVKLADDKIKTKQFLQARGIPVPKMIARINDLDGLEKFDWNVLPSSFVLKPNTGFGGEGILVIKDRKKQYFVKINGEKLWRYDLENHIESILSGRYSISNTYDTAFFEQRLIPHDFFNHFTSVGLPDIRIVVHNLIPVMAMIRIPTKESEGKANVHLGGVGIGVDIAKGETTYAVQYDSIIQEIPGVGSPKGFKVPYWDEILLIASKLQQITNLGYLACDIVIDKVQGPVLLELNARAGLMVQIANLAPLKKRLERIKGIKVNSPEKGVRIGQDLFGQKVEKEIKNISGKEVIGHRENIEIHLSQGGTKTVLARIRPDLEKTRYSFTLMEELREIGEIKREGHESFKAKFTLAGKKIQTLVGVADMSEKDYDAIIGRRDLKDFLVDPLKEYCPFQKKIGKIDFKSIDKRICDIDGKLKLIAYLKPTNLEEEEEKFMQDTSYNPQFEYAPLDFDPDDLLDRLRFIETDDSPLGNIFEKKKREIQSKIELLQHRGNAETFTNISTQLFPKPTLRYVRDVKSHLKNYNFQDEEKKITTEQAKERFEEVFEHYDLSDWKVSLKKNMVVNCSAGKGGTLFLKEGSTFSELKLVQLIRHEIETHILTSENGSTQPYQVFRNGMGNYLLTQEGLAIYNQTHFVGKEGPPQGWGLYAVHSALEKSFAETYKDLIDLGIPKDIAFRTTVKVKRGLADTSQPGAFTKDAIYVIGYHKILDFIKKGGDMKKLYIGKVNVDDIELLDEIKELKPPKFLPEFVE